MYNDTHTHTHNKDVNFVIELPIETKEFANDVSLKSDLK